MRNNINLQGSHSSTVDSSYFKIARQQEEQAFPSLPQALVFVKRPTGYPIASDMSVANQEMGEYIRHSDETGL
jgi:hypothetical protein